MNSGSFLEEAFDDNEAMTDASHDPHAGQPVLRQGPSPAHARLTVVLVHGRGDSAAGILRLADEFDAPDLACLAPQAANQTWYPHSFLMPMDQNEPGISSGLGVLASLIETLRQAGVSPERVVILGFSQGACLSLEFAARHARRYAALSG